MISLKNLNFHYRENNPVLTDLNLEIGSGHIYGLLGKNGEGKTTLLKLLSGLLFAKKGQCEVLGENPKKRSVNFLQQIYFLPEEPQIPNIGPRAYCSSIKPFYPSFREDIWLECLEKFEIDPYIELGKLSMGQRKKVAIALALAVHTPLLLMDEPTNGLDIPSKAVFRKLVASFLEPHQTMIISTHQVRDLESLIDSVIILNDETIILNTSLENVKEEYIQLENLFMAAIDEENVQLFRE